MKKILIIGGDSQLGKAIKKKLNNHLEQEIWITTKRKQCISKNNIYLDLSEDNPSLPSYNFDTAYFCAGITSIAMCNKFSELAKKCNLTNTVALSKKLSDAGCKVVFLSTNLVFDGEKPYSGISDILNPKVYYGELKAQAEKDIQLLSKNNLIIRLTKIISFEDRLINDWINSLKQEKDVFAFKNMYVAPVFISDACRYIVELALHASGGIWHISGKKDVSYYDIANYIANALKVDCTLVHESDVYNTDIIFVPRYTTLDSSMTENKLNILMPDSLEAVKNIVRKENR